MSSKWLNHLSSSPTPCTLHGFFSNDLAGLSCRDAVGRIEKRLLLSSEDNERSDANRRLLDRLQTRLKTCIHSFVAKLHAAGCSVLPVTCRTV